MNRRISKLTPTRFRAMLIASMALLLVTGIGGFYAAQQTMSAYASEISTKVTEAESSKNSVQQLKQLEIELEQLADVRERASSIVAESQSYQYQNQIIADLNNYASQAGITISQFSFQSTDPNTTASATPSPVPSRAAPVVTGRLKSTTVDISLNPPISYTNLLRFMRSIEQNLTKMQISGVTLTPGEGAESVSINTLSIEVYIK